VEVVRRCSGNVATRRAYRCIESLEPTVSKATTTPPTRRARRAADREAANSTRRRAASPPGRSPLLLITGIVGGVGVIVLGALILLQGGSGAVDETTALVSPLAPTPVTLADGRAVGKVDAPVTLEVWTDFQCPVCGQFAKAVEPALMTRYVTPGVLRIVHHDAAFQGAKADASYDESVEAGAGGRCAADQGRYWPYQDWTFANQSGENEGAYAATRLTAIATAAGLDIGAWQACVSTGAAQEAVRTETSRAVAAGVSATPTMSINGQTIVGLRSVTDLGSLIEAAAAASGR
jgi:protein-disulfide isomerase